MAQTKGEVMHLAELKQKSIADLNEVARDLKIDGAPTSSKAGINFCDSAGADREQRRGLRRRRPRNTS